MELIVIAASSHPIWVIEEYAISFCKDNWLKEPNDPTIIDEIIAIVRRVFLSKLNKRVSGAIFCHVIKIKQFSQVNPSMILGNQKWKGAAPNFNRRVAEIR